MVEGNYPENMKKGEKTKYRLARSMKECLESTSVDNITVKQITENCGLTRQTFYRNFLDKFDLINWYFDKLLVKSFEHMGKGKTETRKMQALKILKICSARSCNKNDSLQKIKSKCLRDFSDQTV